MPSRLFVYYYERLMEGTVSYDAGAMIRDGIKVINKRGVCPESLWPYNISRFAEQPPIQCSIEALKERAVKYQRITQDLTFMKSRLASGLPFVFGVDVFQSFMAATDGVIPMPAQGEALEGGHALLCVGYDDAEQRFLFRNSWGTSWGKQGYGTIPYEYLVSAHASDFWCVQVVGSVIAQLIDGFERFIGMPGD
jgi:C1A family cysteine protease